MEKLLARIHHSLANRLVFGSKSEQLRQFMQLESHPRQRRIRSGQNWFSLSSMF